MPCSPGHSVPKSDTKSLVYLFHRTVLHDTLLTVFACIAEGKIQLLRQQRTVGRMSEEGTMGTDAVGAQW